MKAEYSFKYTHTYTNLTMCLATKSLNKFKETQNIQAMNAIKLEYNIIKVSLKFLIYLETRNHTLN